MFENPMEMMKQFNEFRNNFNGDPKAEVQRLLSTGQMTQQQFNQLQGMATRFQDIIRNFR